MSHSGQGSSAFAGLLRDFRLQAGLTQHQLAHLSAMSVRAIRDLERGRVRRPRRTTVTLLADALGLAGLPRAVFEVVARTAGM